MNTLMLKNVTPIIAMMEGLGADELKFLISYIESTLAGECKDMLSNFVAAQIAFIQKEIKI